MSTELAKEQTSVKAFFDRQDVKTKFQEMLGKRSTQFVASVLQVITQNAHLKKADPVSIYSAAVMAATLGLPINQNLGFAYIIPYGNVAQFQMGYKGFIQLAQRSGQYKTISAAPVYEGQLIGEDPLKGYEFDWKAKTSNTIIGFAAYISLINGFEKTLYMTTDELSSHAKKYSKTYSSSSSKWKTDFEAMAMKTVIKLLLSKYGPLSVEMQMAITADQAVIKDADTMDVEYVDNEDAPVEKNYQNERWIKLIQQSTTIDEVDSHYEDGMPAEVEAVFLAKKEELRNASK